MKLYLVISIDVEPDCSQNWRYSNPLKFDSVSIGIADRLQPLFNRYDVTPTYLINNVVLEDAGSVEVFGKLAGKYELGTHLHPEFIEPEKLYHDYSGKKAQKNCCYYPASIESEKIKNITDLFVNVFGYRPTSFRAGRFSAGLNTMTSLRKLGYLVDSSLTPHVLWNDPSRERPVDFSHAPEQPYFIHQDKLFEEDPQGDLLEVPVSIALKKRNWIKESLVSGAGFIHPFRKNKAIWLRPFYSSTQEMISIARQFMTSYHDRDFIVLNMMFHNVEVLPGMSPYTQSEKECRQYMQQLQDFYIYCQKENIQSIALSRLHDLYHKK